MGHAEGPMLDALYRGATDDVELDYALALLMEHFACRGAALVSLDTRRPEIGVSRTAGVYVTAVDTYLEHFAAIDPAPALFARQPIGTATTTDRMISAQERSRSAFLHEFYRPLGLEETLGGTLDWAESRFELIGLHRGRDRSPFDDGEVGALERLMPHVKRALQLRRAFFRLEARTVGLEAALDRLEAGVLLLDAAGSATFANRAMHAIARRGDGLALDRAGHPLPASGEARRQIAKLIDEVSRGGSGGVTRVPRTGPGRAYAVLVAPSLAVSEGRDGHGGVLLLVHDPEGDMPAVPDILARGFHLPPGAAKLVAALASEEDLESFADREGVTIHTARFHLRTALARTGARSQAELVGRAVRLLRDFALCPNHQDTE